jgi:hypothetical protein
MALSGAGRSGTRRKFPPTWMGHGPQGLARSIGPRSTFHRLPPSGKLPSLTELGLRAYEKITALNRDGWEGFPPLVDRRASSTGAHGPALFILPRNRKTP